MESGVPRKFNFPAWKWKSQPVEVSEVKNEEKEKENTKNNTFHYYLNKNIDFVFPKDTYLCKTTSLYFLTHPNIRNFPKGTTEYDKMEAIKILAVSAKTTMVHLSTTGAAVVATDTSDKTETHFFHFDANTLDSTSTPTSWLENVFALLDRSNCIQIFNGEFYFGVLRKYVQHQQRMIYWRFCQRDIFEQIHSRYYATWPSLRNLFEWNVLEKTINHTSAVISSPSSSSSSSSLPTETKTSEYTVKDFINPDSIVKELSDSSLLERVHQRLLKMAAITHDLYQCIEENNSSVVFMKTVKKGTPPTRATLCINWELMGIGYHEKPPIAKEPKRKKAKNSNI